MRNNHVTRTRARDRRDASDYARALLATERRYRDGYMAKSTRDVHIRHLQAIVHARGLASLVVKDLLQLQRNARRRARRRS